MCPRIPKNIYINAGGANKIYSRTLAYPPNGERVGVNTLWCEGGFLLFALRFGLGLPLFSRLVARSVLATGSPCILQGLCVAQRPRLEDLLAV